jgi:hypothetical protein
MTPNLTNKPKLFTKKLKIRYYYALRYWQIVWDKYFHYSVFNSDLLKINIF